MRRRPRALGFEEALAAEPARIADNWAPWWFDSDRGFYGRQLEHYFSVFPREQVLVLLYEDLLADVAGTLRKICAFANIDPTFEFDVSVRHNAAPVPRSPQLDRFIRRPNRLKRLMLAPVPSVIRKAVGRTVRDRNLQRATPTPAARERLIEEHRTDIGRLQELIGRDLSAWLTV